MSGQLRVLQGLGLRLERPCTRATSGAGAAMHAQVPEDHHIHHGSGAPASCHAQGWAGSALAVSGSLCQASVS